MRPAEECEELLGISMKQERVSVARDYWQGVTDGVRFALGEVPEALQARLTVEHLDDVIRLRVSMKQDEDEERSS